MSRLHTTAVVLRRWPYSENSLVVHLLTPDAGLLPALAKGVFQLRSGQLGVLDTFALVEVELGPASRSDLHSLYASTLVDRFSGLSADVDRLAAAGLLAEVAELAAPAGSHGSAAFLFLVEALQELSHSDDARRSLLAHLSRSLDLLGLRPQLGEGQASAPRWLEMAGGSLLDEGAPRPQQAALPVAPAVLNALRHLQHDPAAAAVLQQNHAEDCLTILGEFLAFHLERPPKAWKVIQQRPPAPIRQS